MSMHGAFSVIFRWFKVRQTHKILTALNYNQQEMAVLVESHTLLALIERLKSAETLVKRLSDELKSIKHGIVQIQKSGELDVEEFSRPFDSDIKKKKNESKDCCDNVPKRQKLDFSKEDEYVVAFTDGACENNGRANAKAGIGVWFGPDHPLNVSQPVDGRPTNNTAEIQACIAALTIASAHGITKLKIKTDSQFTINCMTKWIHKWKKNQWKLANGGDVKNKEDLVKLDDQCRLMDDIQWEYVAGHKGITGNEEADKLARTGALSYRSK